MQLAKLPYCMRTRETERERERERVESCFCRNLKAAYRSIDQAASSAGCSWARYLVEQLFSMVVVSDHCWYRYGYDDAWLIFYRIIIEYRSVQL
jgi:hypothetical protein